MGFQSATNTGSGNTLSVGPLTPSQNNMLGFLVANDGLSFTPTSPGWLSQGSVPNVYYQQFSNTNPVSVTATITGHPDNNAFSENWNAVLLLLPTTGTASLVDADAPLYAESNSCGTSSPFAVTKGQTIIAYMSNASAGDEGQMGEDPGVYALADNSGNNYGTPVHVVVSMNDQGAGVFTYATYVYVTTAIETNANLIISLCYANSSQGPLGAEAYMVNEVNVNSSGFTQGQLLMW